MAAEVEIMFYIRETPWHGLGTRVMAAPTSKEALFLSALNWKVEQEQISTKTGNLISAFKVNIRDTDQKILGVVTDRYKSNPE